MCMFSIGPRVNLSITCVCFLLDHVWICCCCFIFFIFWGVCCFSAGSDLLFHHRRVGQTSHRHLTDISQTSHRHLTDMDTYLFPEFQELFREFPRLARKLSLQELRALKNFLDRRLLAEHSRLVQRVTSLELSRHADDHRFSRAISTLEQESREKRQLAAEYKRGFGNMAQVLANKEGRFEGKYEKVLSQVETLEDELRRERKTNVSLQEDNERRDQVIGNLHRDIENLKRSNEEKSDYHAVLRECKDLHKNLLRAKLELELQRKNNDNLVKELDVLGGVKENKRMSLGDVLATRESLHDTNRSLPITRSGVWPKSFEDSDVTYLAQAKTPRVLAGVAYSCTDPQCRAAYDLAQCRAQLVRTTENNARLGYLLAQARADSSGMDRRYEEKKNDVDVDYYRPRGYVTRHGLTPGIDHPSPPTTTTKPPPGLPRPGASNIPSRHNLSQHRLYQTKNPRPTYK
ncbi:uncharacterized protein LOC118478377 [Aplysia californica]|uniref:Uncharacterized protein LOC118478377 n=1 Tax=Aplysia californica TaxID=6500 RepID=A0ABM1VZ96_APLCA|nr:uncharacterized protein LOC118478377 [Aplysia californica]